jgi:uncharacterized protein YbaR (Trm112 family)
VRVRRASDADSERNRKWDEHVAACKAEGIVEPDAEVVAKIKELNEKFSLKNNHEIDTKPERPVMENIDCPHCGKALPISAGVRRMTSQELRDLADVMEQIEKQSAANREANKLHARKCIEEQLANLPATPIPAISDEDEELTKKKGMA